jgi:hypothetical protein
VASAHVSRQGHSSLLSPAEAPGSISVKRVRRKNRHTGQTKDGYGDIDHRSASCPPITVRYLLPDWSQSRSSKNCMVIIPSQEAEDYAASVSALFRHLPKMVSLRWPGELLGDNP